jgi:mevalonate kinase
VPAAASVAASAPGKLILMGEHAVVYGRPALVAAVDLRLTVRLHPATGVSGAVVRLDLPGLRHREETSWAALLAYARAARERWADYARRPTTERFRAVRGDDPAHVVKVALGEAAAFLGGSPGPPVAVAVESQLPIGSGFGSSAATAVAVLGAYLAWRSALTPEALERLALEVERRQHGLPSGVDGATVIHGGVLWARRLPAGGIASEPVAARSPLLSRLCVYDTGTPPEPTGAVVAAVRDGRERDPAGHERLLDRMEEATRSFRDQLAGAAVDPRRVLDAIREQQACLEALGVVPAAVREVARRVEAAGGAAKVSGAGSLAGPGAGSLLVYHPEPERIAHWSFLAPFPFYPVHLGAAGFHLGEPLATTKETLA